MLSKISDHAYSNEQKHCSSYIIADLASNTPEDTHLFVGKGGGDGGEGDNVGEEHGHVFLGLGRDLNGSDRHNKYTQRGKLG